MKHPGHKNAKNQYEGRAGGNLSKESKESHKKTMQDFQKHLKKIGVS
tara:strand:+ start:510 stop:650 length:141 start_codon:yes stop_codon:yes gene_type:complete